MTTSAGGSAPVSHRTTSPRRLSVAISCAFVVLATTVGVFQALPSQGATSSAGPLTVTATPTDGLADGQVVAVHAEVPGSSQLFEVRARICQHSAGIKNWVDFSYQGPNCPPVAVGAGQADVGVHPAHGTTNVDLTIAVGMGEVAWVDEMGDAHVMACGPGSPCDLVVQAQVPGDTVYATFPLLIGESAPPPSPTTSGGGGSPSSPAAAAADDAGATGGNRTDRGASATSGTSGSASATNGEVRGGTASQSSDHATDSSEVASAVPASMITPLDSSRGTRVFVGGIAGLVGGVLIVMIVVRAGSKMRATT